VFALPTPPVSAQMRRRHRAAYLNFDPRPFVNKVLVIQVHDFGGHGAGDTESLSDFRRVAVVCVAQVIHLRTASGGQYAERAEFAVSSRKAAWIQALVVHCIQRFRQIAQ